MCRYRISINRIKQRNQIRRWGIQINHGCTFCIRSTQLYSKYSSEGFAYGLTKFLKHFLAIFVWISAWWQLIFVTLVMDPRISYYSSTAMAEIKYFILFWTTQKFTEKPVFVFTNYKGTLYLYAGIFLPLIVCNKKTWIKNLTKRTTKRSFTWSKILKQTFFHISAISASLWFPLKLMFIMNLYIFAIIIWFDIMSTCMTFSNRLGFSPAFN